MSPCRLPLQRGSYNQHCLTPDRSILLLCSSPGQVAYPIWDTSLLTDLSDEKMEKPLRDKISGCRGCRTWELWASHTGVVARAKLRSRSSSSSTSSKESLRVGVSRSSGDRRRVTRLRDQASPRPPQQMCPQSSAEEELGMGSP